MHARRRHGALYRKGAKWAPGAALLGNCRDTVRHTSGVVTPPRHRKRYIYSLRPIPGVAWHTRQP